MPNALVVFTDGAEEMETVITVDVLRRAEIDVTLASLTGTEPIKCSRGINIVPDSSLKDALAKQPLYDAIILPGGLPNAKALAASSDAAAALSAHEQGGKIVASICASTIALASHGICKGATVTSFPGVKDEVLKYKHHQYSEDRVCVSQKCITSRGPGTALEFGLELVKQLCGADKAEQVAKPMLVK